MWRNIVLIMVAVLFLLAAGSPVSAYDPNGRIPRVEPSNDEHPWGDENFTNTRPTLGIDQVTVISEGNFSIIVYVQNVWDNIFDKTREVFSLYEPKQEEISVSETKSLRIYSTSKPMTMRKW